MKFAFGRRLGGKRSNLSGGADWRANIDAFPSRLGKQWLQSDSLRGVRNIGFKRRRLLFLLFMPFSSIPPRLVSLFMRPLGRAQTKNTIY